MAGINKRLSACGWGIFCSAMLAIPAVTGLFQDTSLRGENRHLTAFPDLPGSKEALLGYSKLLDLWINDHFGFRDRFIQINNYLRFTLFNEFPTIQVIAGRENRIFLSAHATTQAAYSAIEIPCGYTVTDTGKVARQINALVRSFQMEGVDVKLMIAPSGPMIYPENLPGWLKRRCENSTPPVESMLASSLLDTGVRTALYYPKEDMLAFKNTADIFPKSWFHWAGAGPRAVAGLSVNYFWHIAPDAGKELVVNNKKLASDISHLFPGVLLESQILVADHASSQIEACLGPSCFPALGQTFNKLQEVARYANPAAPAGRLIILSDSFGQFIAGWYPRYFREVLHFSTNALAQLDAQEARAFRDYLFEQANNSQMLILYHDGSVLWDRPAQDQAKLFGQR